MDTALGRTILILFILGISYTNKILGVVAVLFIIIAFNNSNIGYLEGFTNAANIEEQKQQIKENVTKKIDEKKSEINGVEGFNIIEREHMMLRGKRSSEVPVYSNARNQSDDVEPSDKAVFVGNYSSV
jgi:hypothetical protein